MQFIESITIFSFFCRKKKRCKNTEYPSHFRYNNKTETDSFRFIFQINFSLVVFSTQNVRRFAYCIEFAIFLCYSLE